MSQNLKLEVILSAINKATAPLKAITKGSNDTAKALKAARDRLRELNDQQNNINGFRKLDKDIAITANSLKAATEKVKEIKQEMAGVENPTAAMTRSFNKAVREAKSLKQEHSDLIAKQQQLRTQLNETGMDTLNLANHQRNLKTDLAAATAEINQQTAALKKQNDIASRINAARRVRDESLEKRAKIASAGAQALGTGTAIGLPVMKMVKDSAAFETAMLGVARQVNGARDANGNLTKSYYEMGDAIKDMAERLPLTSIEIAQLVEGAARMGIQGKKDLLTFTEQAAIMSAAFDLPADRIAEEMGVIANLYKIPINRIHEFGDAVNYLDDNAQSKGGDIIDVMKRIAGVATFVGMNFKDAAALGSTFLSLGASTEIAATASNAMIMRLANAPILSHAERYSTGLKMLNLDAAKLQKTMNTDATGTLLMVLDKIKSLSKEKQLEAATRLFGVEYGDDAAKLAQNLEEYRRQLKLTQEAKATGSMNRESSARNDSLDSKVEMTKSALFNATSEAGRLLKPVLVDVLALIKDIATNIRAWIKENPELAGNIIKTVAIVSALAIGAGALLIAISGILGPLILLRFAFASGIPTLLSLVSAIKNVGLAIRVVTMFMVANPIVAIIAGIAMAALLIYKYWGPIKTWFSNLWDGITERFNRFIEPFKRAIAGIREYLGFGGNSMTPAMAGANANGVNRSVIKPTQPIRPRGATPVQSITHAPTINVYPSQGMSEAQLSKMVAKELENSNNAAAARGRATLRDRD